MHDTKPLFDNEATRLFQQAKTLMPLRDICSVANVAPSVVERWNEKGVDDHYLPTIKQVMGIPLTEEEAVDKFYTTAEAARFCMEMFHDTVEQCLELDISEHWWLEPSCGDGAFLNLMPAERRLGVDLAPDIEGYDVETGDFLMWEPPAGRKWMVVGNPPFGYKSHLATRFLLKAARFADTVGFILPRGWGTPENDNTGRSWVKSHMLLVETFDLEMDVFRLPGGGTRQIPCVFQIWTRAGWFKVSPEPEIPTCEDFADLFVVNTYASCTRNLGRIDEIDVAITSNSYGEFRAAESFEELGERGAVGVSILQDYDEVRRLLLDYDWDAVARQSASGSRYINVDIVKDAIIAAGFIDEKTQYIRQKLF